MFALIHGGPDAVDSTLGDFALARGLLLAAESTSARRHAHAHAHALGPVHDLEMYTPRTGQGAVD